MADYNEYSLLTLAYINTTDNINRVKNNIRDIKNNIINIENTIKIIFNKLNIDYQDDNIALNQYKNTIDILYNDFKNLQ